MYDATVNYTNEYLRGLPAEDLKQLGQEAMVKASEAPFAEWPLFKKVRRDIARIETAMRKARR